MSGVDDRLREELGALLDDELESGRAAELRARLGTDEALRREYEELRRAVDLLRGLPGERAPDALRGNVRRRIEGSDGEASAARPRGRVIALPGGGWAAVAAVALLGVGLAVLKLGGEPEPRTPERVSAEHDPAKKGPGAFDRVDGTRRDARKAEAAGDGRLRKRTPGPGRPDPDEEGTSDAPGGPAGKATGSAADKAVERREGSKRAGERAAPPVPPVVRDTEAGRRVARKRLGAYLEAVRGLAPERLRRHVRAVAGVDANELVVSADARRGVILARRADALLVREILWRGYVRRKGGVPGITVPDRARHVDLTLRLTDDERVAVTGWLNRLPAAPEQKRRLGSPPPPQPGEKAGTGRQDDRRPVVLRLAWTG